MPTVTSQTLLEQLNWRYATKQFDPKKAIPANIWKDLEASLVLAPSSFGLQPWKFIVVTGKELRKKLRAVSWDQSQIEDASHLVVFAAKTDVGAADVEKLISKISAVRGTPVESLKGYKDMMLGFVTSDFDRNSWAARQVYIALGQFLTSAAILGIDACPLEGLDPKKYDELLGLKGYTTLCVAAAGYRAEGDKYAQAKKVRYSMDEIIIHA